MRRALLLVCLAAGTAHAQWEPEIPLTSTGGDVFGAGLAASGTTIHAIFGNTTVEYRRSVDEGLKWTDPVTLDTGVIHLTDPLVADGQDVWAIYLKNTTTKTDWCCARETGDIYLVHSADNGMTWDAPKQLSSSQSAFRVSMAYAANRLHVVWMDYRNNAWDTYYLRSPDRGASWDAEKKISASMGTFGAERPQVAARGDNVHVTIWNDRGTNPPCMAGPMFSFDPCPDTFYVGSLDGGTTWGQEVAVDYSGAAFSGRNDVAAAGTSSVVINFNRAAAGTADANPHMFVVHSPDNGATWEPAQQLTTTDGSSDHGSIVGAGTAVFLAWHDGRSGTLAIEYRHSLTEGTSWEAEEQVNTANAEASTPLVAVSDSYVHVMWLDKRTGPYQVEYRRRARPIPAGVNDDTLGGDGVDTETSSGCGCESTGTGTETGVALVVVGLGRRRRRRRR